MMRGASWGRHIDGRRLAAFAGAAGLVLLYALRGGTYDLVVRQQAALAIWLTLGFGFAFGVLPLARITGRGWALVAALTALCTLSAVGLTSTESIERTVAEIARNVGYLGLVLLVLSILDTRTWRAAAAGLLFGAVVVCGVSLVSRLAPSLFEPNPLRGSFDISRLAYPFNYWNAVGSFGAMTATSALVWSAHARTTAVRMLTLAAVPAAALCVYLSYSRAGAAGLALGILAAVALASNRRLTAAHALSAGLACLVVVAAARATPSIAHGTGAHGAGTVLGALVLAMVLCVVAVAITRSLRIGDRSGLGGAIGRISIGCCALVIVIVASVFGPPIVTRQWHSFQHPTLPRYADPAQRLTTLSGTRYQVWASSLRAFRAHPIEGTGPGTFEFWWNRDGTNSAFIRDAHSLYLESLAESGLPGLLAVLAVAVTALWVGLRTRLRLSDPCDQGVVAALTAGFTVFLFQAGVDWMWEMTAVGAAALGAVAIAATATAERHYNPFRLWTRALMTICALVACLIQLPGLVSTSEVRRSQHSFESGSLGRALRQANDAVATEPWAATPYVQRALLLEAEGEFRAARTDLTRGHAMEPTNWRPELLLARVDAELGMPVQAVEAFGRAQALRPRSETFGRP